MEKAKLKKRIERRFAELGVDTSSVPKNPTKEDVAAAFAFLRTPLITAGIADEEDIAIALSMIMSAVIGLRPKPCGRSPGSAGEAAIV